MVWLWRQLNQQNNFIKFDRKLALYLFLIFFFFFFFFFSNSTFAHIRGPCRVLEFKSSLSHTHPNRGAGANIEFSSLLLFILCTHQYGKQVFQWQYCLKGQHLIAHASKTYLSFATLTLFSFLGMKNRQVKSQF